ncbi:MAG: DNA polymerase I, thermostable [bacterium ADurb.Bin212]|nr:MAG: DNA polymerase I, thermostable [bacterium ADurb.Bin212]
MWSHLKGKSIIVPQISSDEISKQLEPVLREMEKVGIRLDVHEFSKLEKKLTADSLNLKAHVLELAGEDFNIDSPSQMAAVLFDKLKLPTEGLKRTKSGPSTAASELNKIKDKHSIIAPILEYRELAKLLSTYLTTLPKMVDKNSRLHTHYAQDVATGRISSNDPNLQNIPIKGRYGEEIRRSFVASPGNVLISADYSQIELRIVACLAEDKEMIKSFNSGRDIHSETAADIFKKDSSQVTSDERRFAKTINFGVLYGMSPYGLSQALNIGVDSAAEYIRRYNEVYSGISAYCKRMITEAKEKGYVETLFGYRRVLPNINSNNRYLAEAEERMAINTPVQGTAAEILKLSMLDLDREFNNQGTRNKIQTNSKINIQNSKKLSPNIYNLKPVKAQLLLTVHDELVVEAPEAEAGEVAKVVKVTMENVIKLCVPIEVEVGIGKNWAESK